MSTVVAASWGTRWIWKFFFSGVAVSSFYGASPFGDAIASEPTGLGTRIGLIALGCSLLLIGNRPRIRLTRDAVILSNIFTTSVVPLDDIIRVEPRGGGLWFERRQGRESQASFVGEAGLLSQLLGRHTRGHEIAAAITEAIAVRASA